MGPVIRIDDQVMDKLQKEAIHLGLVFGTPNAVLRAILDLNADQTEALAGGVPGNAIEFEFRDNDRRYGRFYLRGLRGDRRILPGFKRNFELVTDDHTGVFLAHVYSAPKGTPIGDPNAGKRIRGRLRPWFDRHPELKAGDTLRIEALEPGTRYRLSIIS
jgi:hypothetical protein